MSSDDQKTAHRLFPVELHPIATFVEENHPAALDMSALTLCDHTVFTVGSFGWWASFLRESRRLSSGLLDGKVISIKSINMLEKIYLNTVLFSDKTLVNR